MESLGRILGLSAVASVPLLAYAGTTPAGDKKPNVIFILLDDYGYSDLGCYGSSYYLTPNIDKLAKRGIRFTDAYAACPVSSPTRASILTGKYPVNTGITDWIPGRQASINGGPDDRLKALPFRQQLELSEVTIAEVLKQNGYRTMISGKWHLGGTPEFWPENQGFDINKGGYSAGQPNKGSKSNGYFSPYGNPRLEDGPAGEYLTDRQTDDAIAFLGEKNDKPFFLYLSYYAVHNPMQGKEELIRKFQHRADSMGLSGKDPFTRDRDWIKPWMSNNFKERVIQSYPVYAAMIYSVDENLGRLFRKLTELGLDKNTIIIFTSDNGGLSTSEGSPTCNSPLREGKGWLYEGGIRVPLIISIPGRKGGYEIHDPVCSIDFYNTIAEMTGSEKFCSSNDGVSLMPLIKSGHMKTRPLFWHYPHYSNQGTMPGSAIRLGDYKLIDNFETGKKELYNLKNDLSETKDLAASEPSKVNELFTLLEAWRRSTHANNMEPNPDYKR